MANGGIRSRGKMKERQWEELKGNAEGDRSWSWYEEKVFGYLAEARRRKRWWELYS